MFQEIHSPRELKVGISISCESVVLKSETPVLRSGFANTEDQTSRLASVQKERESRGEMKYIANCLYRRKQKWASRLGIFCNYKWSNSYRSHLFWPIFLCSWLNNTPWWLKVFWSYGFMHTYHQNYMTEWWTSFYTLWPQTLIVILVVTSCQSGGRSICCGIIISQKDVNSWEQKRES